MSLLSQEANNRMKVAGLTRYQIIDRAKSIVLDWFEKNSYKVERYNKAQALSKGLVFRVIESKQKDSSPFWYVSLHVMNNTGKDVTISSLQINDEDFFIQSPDKPIRPQKSVVLKGFVVDPDTTLSSVTSAYVGNIQIYDNEFKIPDGFNQFLDHIGYAHMQNGELLMPPKSP
jgi:UTP-glucose-1-phosphate uridylyltransferase